MSDEKIKIELVYALPAEQFLLKSEVPKGTTIAEAVKLSGFRTNIPKSTWKRANSASSAN